MSLGSGHDENHARRRLFNGLQERIERTGGQHVHFIDDEDLVAVARRSKTDRADDCLAHIIDTGVGSGIDLLHVNRAAF